jgi:hypothetical protein
MNLLDRRRNGLRHHQPGNSLAAGWSGERALILEEFFAIWKKGLRIPRQPDRLVAIWQVLKQGSQKRVLGSFGHENREHQPRAGRAPVDEVNLEREANSVEQMLARMMKVKLLEIESRPAELNEVSR